VKNNTRHIEILTVAAELFFQRGFANTKIIDIANKAGLSKGLVYFYYANKEDLFLAVLDKGLDMNLALLEATLNEMEEKDGLTRSFTLLERFLEMGEHTAFFQEIIIQSMQLTNYDQSPDIAKKMGVSEKIYESERLQGIRDKQLKIYEVVRSAIEDGQKDGSIPNKAPASVIYLSVWSFIIGYETMLPVMKNHRSSILQPKHEYLMLDPQSWRNMILEAAKNILKS
jgi:AcrR family transcriptional regulator